MIDPPEIVKSNEAIQHEPLPANDLDFTAKEVNVQDTATTNWSKSQIDHDKLKRTVDYEISNVTDECKTQIMNEESLAPDNADLNNSIKTTDSEELPNEENSETQKMDKELSSSVSVQEKIQEDPGVLPALVKIILTGKNICPPTNVTKGDEEIPHLEGKSKELLPLETQTEKEDEKLLETKSQPEENEFKEIQLEVDQQPNTGCIASRVEVIEKTKQHSVVSEATESKNELGEIDSPYSLPDNAKLFPISSWKETGVSFLEDGVMEALSYQKVGTLCSASFVEQPTKDIYTIAVLSSNEGIVSVSQSNKEVIQWKLCNLKGNLFSILLPSPWDGLAFERGNVLAICCSQPKKVFIHGKSSICLSITKSAQIISLGTSDSISNCRSKDNGEICSHLVNRTKAPYCHIHLRQEYFTVSSNNMQLNMNVGLGPVKATSCGKRKREQLEDNEAKSFRDFTISSGNESNIENHPWYNLPDTKQVDKIIASRDSVGSKYLTFNPETAFEESRKKSKNRAIPLQFRNKPRRPRSDTDEPPAKRQKTSNKNTNTVATAAAILAGKRRVELLNKVRKSTRVVLSTQ